jgi:hypothetical protein
MNKAAYLASFFGLSFLITNTEERMMAAKMRKPISSATAESSSVGNSHSEAPPVLKEPSGHAEQLSALLAPSEFAKVPAGQLTGSAARSSEQNCPAGHVLQLDSENAPLEEPKRPSPQLTHSLAAPSVPPSELQLPGGHASQVAEPAGAKDPAAQGTGARMPSLSQRWPTRHSVQSSTDSAKEISPNVPGGQPVHWEAPISE